MRDDHIEAFMRTEARMREAPQRRHPYVGRGLTVTLGLAVVGLVFAFYSYVRGMSPGSTKYAMIVAIGACVFGGMVVAVLRISRRY